MTPSVALPDLEAHLRHEALALYLKGEEEGALDLLAVAREMAAPAFQGAQTPSHRTHTLPSTVNPSVRQSSETGSARRWGLT